MLISRNAVEVLITASTLTEHPAWIYPGNLIGRIRRGIGIPLFGFPKQSLRIRCPCLHSGEGMLSRKKASASPSGYPVQIDAIGTDRIPPGGTVRSEHRWPMASRDPSMGNRLLRLLPVLGINEHQGRMHGAGCRSATLSYTLSGG